MTRAESWIGCSSGFSAFLETTSCFINPSYSMAFKELVVGGDWTLGASKAKLSTPQVDEYSLPRNGWEDFFEKVAPNLRPDERCC